MDGGTWWATVHGVAKSQTQLSDFTLLHFRDIHKFAGISASKQVRLHIPACKKSGKSGNATFFGQ